MSTVTTDGRVWVYLCDFTRKGSRRQLRERIGDELYIRAMYAREAPAARYNGAPYRAAQFVAVLLGRTGHALSALVESDELVSFVKLIGELFDCGGGPEVVPLDLDPAVLHELEAEMTAALQKRLGDIEVAGHG